MGVGVASLAVLGLWFVYAFLFFGGSEISPNSKEMMRF